MKAAFYATVLALSAGSLAFFFMRSHKPANTQEILLDVMPELTWIKSDLGANDAQFTKITELHLAYRPKCEELCQRISAAHAKVEKLSRVSREMTPELEAAIREHAKTHSECQQAMIEHIYRTAALLDAAQSTRFIEAVLPIVLDYSRHAASHSERSRK